MSVCTEFLPWPYSVQLRTEIYSIPLPSRTAIGDMAELRPPQNYLKPTEIE
jgi:hypothetical protein